MHARVADNCGLTLVRYLIWHPGNLPSWVEWDGPPIVPSRLMVIQRPEWPASAVARASNVSSGEERCLLPKLLQCRNAGLDGRVGREQCHDTWLVADT